jgi:CheY-like chemotaxis protein
MQLKKPLVLFHVLVNNNCEVRKMKKIMIVDDDQNTLQTLKQSLEYMNADYKVTCASNGMQCLKLLENNEIPDLILLDIMMPEMDGWETFKNLHENPLWKNIPVFFLTARSDGVAKNAVDFLAAEYIQKPYDIEDLKIKINKVLKNTGNIGKE